MAFGTSGYGGPLGITITPWVKRLLIANGAVFLIAAVLNLAGYSGLIREYFYFTPAVFLSRPWTLLTYAFLHVGFFHLFFNLLTLVFFGPRLEERWGSREFIKFYLISAAGGALLSLLQPYTPIVGASAAVYGIMMAYALAWPDDIVHIWGIFPVKVKWLVVGLAVMGFFAAAGNSGGGVAHLAHLGGFASAFLYLKSPWAPDEWGGVAPTRKKKKKPVLAGRGGDPKGPSKPAPTPARTNAERELLDDVDQILEKISKNGLGSLTDRERERLNEVSRRYRTN